MAPRDQYENAQLKEITAWKVAEPGIVSVVGGKLLAPLAWLAQRVVPQAAVEGALSGSNWLASRLAGRRSILQEAGVERIEQLQSKPLEICDGLAEKAQAWAIGLAVVEGGATGVGGLAGIAIDIPTSVTLALRTIHRIGLCYGFDGTADRDRQFVLGILGAAGANSIVEKNAALATLRTIEVMIAKLTWKKITEEAAAKQFGKEAAIVAVRSLAKQLGVNLTKRKALMAIPIVGALVGASVNGWFIRDVSLAARRSFQERWLIVNGKLLEEDPPTAARGSRGSAQSKTQVTPAQPTT